METNINYENLSLEEQKEVIDSIFRKFMNRLYCKKHYENNKEEYKKRNRKFRENNPLYHKQYSELNPEKIEEIRLKQKKKNIGNYVYFLTNTYGNNVYIGSTIDMQNRMSAHLKGSSNIKQNYKELVENYGLDNIVYLDLSDFEMNRTELYYIEYYLKQKHKELIENKVRIDLDKIEDNRKKELEGILSKVDVKIFDDSKYWDM